MTDCDFIPSVYHEQRRVKRALRQRSGCVVAMFGMMLIWLVSHHYQLKSAEAMLKSVQQQQSQLGLVSNKRLELDRERAELVEHRQLVDRLSDQANLLVVLSDLSRCMPETVVLTDVTLNASFMTPYLVEAGEAMTIAPPPRVDSKGKATAPEAIPAPPMPIETLRLSGIALTPQDVFEFASRVEKSGLFAHPYSQVLAEKDWGGRRAAAFELTCELIPHERSSQ